MELTIAIGKDGQSYVVTPPLTVSEGKAAEAVHAINLLLEIFGECDVFDSQLTPLIPAKLKRLNWRILPPGIRPWNKLRDEVAEVLAVAREGNRPVIENRLEILNSFQPVFTAVGNAGFQGYIVFGFPAVGLYVLESILYGNATYILDEGWEAISKLTKAEILSENLHKGRIIHRASCWESELTKWLQECGLPKKAA